ncbi:MAG: hypothetical protein U0794_05355 [Isosphaeraceae bacterium]
MRPSRWPLVGILLVTASLTITGVASAQLPTSEERLKILTDPESVKKKLDKDRTRPPLELSLTQIAPFDVLPFVKGNHWISMTLDLVSNYDDFEGAIETSPVMMAGLPQEIIYGRDARLPKTQHSRLGLQLIFPEVPSSLELGLTRADVSRPVESWQATLRKLEPHQMLVVFLSKEPSDIYAGWNRLQAFYPQSADRTDQLALEKQRYYRTIMPLNPDRPPLSPHPLTWTTISHVIWDGLPPDNLNPSQQQAMLDWLHWGGQLTIMGGAGPFYSVLRDSFIAPYLPADVTGDNALLTKDDLSPLSMQYRPPMIPTLRTLEGEVPVGTADPVQYLNRRYLPPVPIEPKPNRPVYLAGLQPKAGSQTIPLGEGSQRILAVEQRVGRGRILMLGLSLSDPAIATWPGIDTLIRRVVLRRPEEGRATRLHWDGMSYRPPQYGPLSGTDLSWFRFVSRDLGGTAARVPVQPAPSPATSPRVVRPAPRGSADDIPTDLKVPEVSVADWNDGSTLPRLARASLETASGIKIPNAGFVLKLLIAYILALVPLNWIICRYLFNRRELAWIVVPALALVFAIGVERAAAYDLGYDSACDEIDVMEVFADYPRAHVSRFGSLYTTGRTRYSVTFPNDPTALVLPLDNGRSLRGEDVSTATFRSFPVPTLRDYLVQPRSLALFRAEQMLPLDGPIRMVNEEGSRQIINGLGSTIHDAALIELNGSREGERSEVYLGDIAPGATIDVKAAPARPTESTASGVIDRASIIEAIKNQFEDRPENTGEIRLVGWTEGPVSGESIDPPVDRHRGVTIVVAHLRFAPPPSVDAPRYYDLSTDTEPPPRLPEGRVPQAGGPMGASRARGMQPIVPRTTVPPPARPGTPVPDTTRTPSNRRPPR